MDEHRDAVQRMQDYIAEHLSDNITLADLSAVSLFSPWYSYRLFIHLTAITPADYIRRFRLSKSALRLRDEKCKVLDVALEFGFGSADGYQRAFYREFGCNPGEYASSPIPLYLFTPYGVKYRAPQKEKSLMDEMLFADSNGTKQKKGSVIKMENAKNIFIQVIEKPARKAIIKRGIKASDYMAYCEEVGCDVWGLLVSIKSIGGEPVSLWLPTRYIKAGSSEYVQGVEVGTDYRDSIPEGFDVIDLPACKYLMFQGEPFAEEDYCEAIEQVESAIKKYDPAVIGYRWDDENPRIQLEPIGARGYIELLAIK